jgi:HSP20 family protein
VCYGRGELELQKAKPARLVTPFEEMDRLFERWGPRGLIGAMQHEMDRIFEDVFPRGWLRTPWERPGIVHELRPPRMDVIDRDEDLLVRAELPGVDKKDIEVSVTDNTLTISAASPYAAEQQGEYYRCEMCHTGFARSLTLPVEVDSDRCQARFHDGILGLVLPKVEKAKRRTIKVS